MEIGDFIPPVLIVQRYGSPVLHRPLEVVHGYVAAEGALGDVVIGQQGCPGKANAGSGRQKAYHVVGEDAVLTAVGLVGENENIVVGVDGLGIGLIELLNQGEDKTGVPPKFVDQIVAAGGHKLSGFRLTQQAAVFKGLADLLVQLVPVGEDHDGGGAGKLPPDLLGQEHHGVALAAALGVPEYPQFAVVQLPGLVCLYRLVDAQILVVSGQNFCGAAAGVVEEDEVFQQIQKVLLFADAPEHRLQGHAARLLLAEALPLVEELVLAAQGAHLGLQTVGEDEKGVVVEQVGDGVQVVGVVVRVGVLHVHGVLLQFHKQQGDPVDESHDIRAAAVQVAVDFQFLDGQEVVVVRVMEVDDLGPLLLGFAVGALDGDGDSVPDEGIFLLVDLHQGGGGQAGLHLLLGFVHLGGGEPRVQALQRLPKIPGEQDLLVAGPAEGAVPAQFLRVIGIGHLPAQLPLQQVSGRFLDENVFGVVVAHGITAYSEILSNSGKMVLPRS